MLSWLLVTSVKYSVKKSKIFHCVPIYSFLLCFKKYATGHLNALFAYVTQNTTPFNQKNTCRKTHRTLLVRNAFSFISIEASYGLFRNYLRCLQYSELSRTLHFSLPPGSTAKHVSLLWEIPSVWKKNEFQSRRKNLLQIELTKILLCYKRTPWFLFWRRWIYK